MSFDDELSRKIEARRSGPSPAAQARDADLVAAEERARPLTGAVEAMVTRLSGSPSFRAIVGDRPQVTVEASELLQKMATVTFEGRSGKFLFQISQPLFTDGEVVPDRVRFLILVDYKVRDAIGCGAFYDEITETNGSMDDISLTVAAAEEVIGEFIADVAVSELGRKWLAGVAPRPALEGPEPVADEPFFHLPELRLPGPTRPRGIVARVRGLLGGVRLPRWPSLRGRSAAERLRKDCLRR